MISNALSPHVQSRPSLLLVPSAMALKAVLILAALGLVYSENSHCSAFGGTNGNDGRDCTCGDKAFSDCLEPVTDDQIHTANLEECKFQCDVRTQIISRHLFENALLKLRKNTLYKQNFSPTIANL